MNWVENEKLEDNWVISNPKCGWPVTTEMVVVDVFWNGENDLGDERR